MRRARVIQLLDGFFGTKYQPGEDVGIFLCRVRTAAARLQDAGHKVDDLYLGFQMISYLPQEFQSTVQQIYRWKDGEFTAGKIEAELILEANRLQLIWRKRRPFSLAVLQLLGNQVQLLEMQVVINGTRKRTLRYLLSRIKLQKSL
ncbi:hypothetical protein AVEN_187400-1 [Araneus ventricosus]|uniref:Uncharacterized protein n=1 Tax=Araneus ventricosus TaxID=182803 RepID=A0A4Y2N5F8_ARAVE|nr:hypothetical protein AVEN_187400-1 [Araneus ventricosus]